MRMDIFGRAVGVRDRGASAGSCFWARPSRPPACSRRRWPRRRRLPEAPIPSITAGAGEQNQIVFSRSGNDVVITDTAGITLDSGLECTQDTANQVSCNDVAGNWLFLVVELKDMNDQLTVETIIGTTWGISADGGTATIAWISRPCRPRRHRPRYRRPAHRQAWGGAGDDTMIGSQGGNLFDGSNRSDLPPDPNYDAGDDTLIGGPVADRLVGGQGADFLDGRDGPDEIFGLVVDNQKSTIREDGAADTLFCGPGAVNPRLGAGRRRPSGGGRRGRDRLRGGLSEGRLPAGRWGLRRNPSGDDEPPPRRQVLRQPRQRRGGGRSSSADPRGASG